VRGLEGKKGEMVELIGRIAEQHEAREKVMGGWEGGCWLMLVFGQMRGESGKAGVCKVSAWSACLPFPPAFLPGPAGPHPAAAGQGPGRQGCGQLRG
jgi:hypothetical protein